MAGGATEAVVGDEDRLPGQGFGLACGALLQAQHLVEIAVEDLALVADVDGAAAHQASDGSRVETSG